MKKHLLKLSVFLVLSSVIYLASFSAVGAHSSGAPAYCTGSPGDGGSNGTCISSGCHTTMEAQENWISSNIPVTGYIPGTAYTITCKAVNTTTKYNSNFGFECSPQTKAGALVGTIANVTTTGTNATQIVSKEWVTHTSKSYATTDSNHWSFTWTAPAAGVGAVSFYACFNCGSGDNNSAAYIYWDSVHFKEASTVGIAQVENSTNEVNVYPNPIKDVFNVCYSLQEAKQVEVNLYSIDGKQMGNLLSNTEQVAGDHTHQLTMPSVAKGIYLIQIIQGDQSTFKKVIVE